MTSPLCCKKSEFQAVFNNLNLYLSPSHEVIEIVKDKNIYYPITKKGILLSSTDLKTAEYVLCFFEINLDCLLEVAKPASFFSKFAPVFQNQHLSKRFFEICQELFRREMVKERAQMRELLIQDVQKEQVTLKNEIYKQRNELEELLNDIDEMKGMKVEMQNTLFLCQEGQKVYTHFKMLKNIPFFEGYDRSGMLKTTCPSITEEEHKQFTYIFQLTDFSPRTIYGFLVWLKDSNCLSRISAFEDLYESYRLADLLNHLKFQESCLEHFEKMINHENVFNILAYAEYYTSDSLIQRCCEHVRDHFKLLSKKRAFLKIKHEYLIEILRKDEIYYEEINIFKAVLNWVDAHRHGRTLQNVLYAQVEGKSLIECIRFQYISKHSYISYKHCFKTQDKANWYEFYLQNKVISDLRCAPTGFFCQSDPKEVEIDWAVPIEDYKKAKESKDGTYFFMKFNFENNSGTIRLHKSRLCENHLCVEFELPTQKKYEFLIQISSLRSYYSMSKDTQFREVARDNRIYKLCYFNLNELDKNVDFEQDFVPIKCRIFLK